MKNRLIACLLSAVILAAPITAQAGMVDNATLLSHEDRSIPMNQVETFMAQEEVRTQLEALGVDPAVAAERIAALPDSQLRQLALDIDNAPAGSGALGLVATVLVIVLLLEILGLTDMSSKI